MRCASSEPSGNSLIHSPASDSVIVAPSSEYLRPRRRGSLRLCCVEYVRAHVDTRACNRGEGPQARAHVDTRRGGEAARLLGSGQPDHSDLVAPALDWVLPPTRAGRICSNTPSASSLLIIHRIFHLTSQRHRFKQHQGVSASSGWGNEIKNN